MKNSAKPLSQSPDTTHSSPKTHTEKSLHTQLKKLVFPCVDCMKKQALVKT
jgi:hypothetical protein